jgi:hypothetical protein
MKEKHQRLLEFFKEEGVELPIDVNNALEDVFNENDKIEDVDVYFKEDAELFGEELVLINDVKAQLKGPSEGKSNNVFTYYGEVDYSLSEFVKLMDGDKVLEDITNVDQLDMPTTVNKSMFAIVLVEYVEWKDSAVTKKPRLYVYCPQESKDAQQEKED